MTASPRIAALALAAVTVLAVAAPTAGAAQTEGAPPAVPSGAETPAAGTTPSVISVERYETPIDTWSGWIVWSRRGSNGLYSLIARKPTGEAISLPVAPQVAPIDASIGPGPHGWPLIVYSQCRVAGPRPRGCDVYRLNPITGNGGRVAAASHPRRDERYPAIWGNKIAFSLSVGKSASHAGIAVADIDRTTPVPRPAIFGPRTERTNGKTVPVRRFGPRGIDLRDGRLAFSWYAEGRSDWWSLQFSGIRKNSSPRQLLAAQTTSSVVSQIGRPVVGSNNVVVPVLRTGGSKPSEIIRTSFDGRRTWTLQGGFSAAQTEQYGSALTAVARTSNSELLVVRRLASDGRWACSLPSAPGAGGCELLHYADVGPLWTPVPAGTSTKRR